MKPLTLMVISFFIGTGASSADIYQVSVYGGLTYEAESDGPPFSSPTPPDPFDASVSQTGVTPYHLTFTFDSSAPVWAYSGEVPGAVTYLSSSTLSLNFGDYSFSQTVSTNGSSEGPGLPIDVFHGETSTGYPPYGYDLISPFGFSIGGVRFISSLRFGTSQSLTDGTLQSILDLDNQNVAGDSGLLLDSIFLGNQSPQYELYGDVTSYSIEDISAPEPSTWALLLVGALGLLPFRRLAFSKLV